MQTRTIFPSTGLTRLLSDATVKLTKEVRKRLEAIVGNVQTLEQNSFLRDDIFPLTNSQYQHAQLIVEHMLLARRAGLYDLLVLRDDGSIDTSKLAINAKANLVHGDEVTPICLVQNALMYIINYQMEPADAIFALLDYLDKLVTDHRDHLDESQQYYLEALFDYFGNLAMRANGSDVTNLFVLISALHQQFPCFTAIKNQNNSNQRCQRYFLPKNKLLGAEHSIDYTDVDQLISDQQSLLFTYEFLTRMLNVSYVESLDDQAQLLHTLRYQKMQAENTAITKIHARVHAGYPLERLELAQVTYAVYAMFNYLPSSGDCTASSSTFKPYAKCWQLPPVTLLAMHAARHLRTFFAAHPALFSSYQEIIIDGFLKHVAFGVNKNDIRAMMPVASAERSQLLHDFVCAGFFSNSPRGQQQFEELQQLVLRDMKQHDAMVRVSQVDGHWQTLLTKELSAPSIINKHQIILEESIIQSSSVHSKDANAIHHLCEKIESIIAEAEITESHLHVIDQVILQLDSKDILNYKTAEDEYLLHQAIKHNKLEVLPPLLALLESPKMLFALNNEGKDVFDICLTKDDAILADQICHHLLFNPCLFEFFHRMKYLLPEFIELADKANVTREKMDGYMSKHDHGGTSYIELASEFLNADNANEINAQNDKPLLH